MTGERPVLRAPRAVLDRAVPGVSLRVLLAAAGGALAVLVLRGDAVLLLGLALALAAAIRPRWGAGWALLALVGVAELLRSPSTVGVELLLLVAGVHAVAVLIGLVAAVPATARVELAALRRPAARALVLQLPCQLAAVAVLLLRGSLALPVAGVLGAVALVGLVLLLRSDVAE